MECGLLIVTIIMMVIVTNTTDCFIREYYSKV